jgi:hypothetical protein
MIQISVVSRLPKIPAHYLSVLPMCPMHNQGVNTIHITKVSLVLSASLFTEPEYPKGKPSIKAK